MQKLRSSEKPVIRPAYTHMLHADSVIWTRFLQSEHNKIIEVWYDVHVGTPVQVPRGSSEMLKKLSSELTRKRIDVVARMPGEIWIIEVKPRASMQALGQILTYRELFITEYEHTEPVLAYIVCESMDQDIEKQLAALLVNIVKV